MSKHANIVLSAFCENLKESRQKLERLFESHFEMFDPVVTMGDEYSLHKKYWIKDKVGLFTASELKKEVVAPGEPTFMILFKTKDLFVDLFVASARKNNENLYVLPVDTDDVKIDTMLPMLSKFMTYVASVYMNAVKSERAMKNLFEVLTTLNLRFSDNAGSLDECYKNLIKIHLIYNISNDIGFKSMPYTAEDFPAKAASAIEKAKNTLQKHYTSTSDAEFCDIVVPDLYSTEMLLNQDFMNTLNQIWQNGTVSCSEAGDSFDDVFSSSDYQCRRNSRQNFFDDEYEQYRLDDEELELEEDVLPSPPKASLVQFSAISPKKLDKGDYSIIDIYMYEEAFKSIVEQALAEADQPSKATTSGYVEVQDKTSVKVELSSPDIQIDDNVSECVWNGRYQRFSFDVYVPEDYSKKKVLFTANVYINGVIATKLKILADCESANTPMQVERFDISRAFVSYASQDRNTVTMIVQGLRKARPDLQVFFDVETLRSGEKWENELRKNIDSSDIFFLCWSHSARESQWVDYEWRYAYDRKGIDFIEPIPLEAPADCQPPEELSSKHFNDLMLYIRK